MQFYHKTAVLPTSGVPNIFKPANTFRNPTHIDGNHQKISVEGGWISHIMSRNEVIHGNYGCNSSEFQTEDL